MSPPPLNPNTFRFPFDLTDQPKEVQQAHVFAFNAVLDIQNAISALNSKVQAIKSGGTTTVNTSTGGGTIIINGNNFPGLGGVNNQTGATAYKTLASDNGIFLIFGDASPVTLTLDSALTTPFFFFASNFGGSNVTLTPTTGTVNQPTLDVGGLYIVVFDGTNWEVSALIVGASTAFRWSTIFSGG